VSTPGCNRWLWLITTHLSTFLGVWSASQFLHEYLLVLIPYESGVDPVGDGWTQSQVRYYVFALLFVMFDVEAVFIFPWATRLEAYGWFGAHRDGHLRRSSCCSASSTPGARVLL
jgi:NADH:ubiquinone oxidoreductase subunit 3 (subunit A)